MLTIAFLSVVNLPLSSTVIIKSSAIDKSKFREPLKVLTSVLAALLVARAVKILLRLFILQMFNFLLRYVELLVIQYIL